MEKHDSFQPNRKFWFPLFFLYIGVLSFFILLKHPKKEIHNVMYKSYNKGVLKRGINAANFVPFHTIKLYLSDRMPRRKAILNLWGNFLGFIPAGFMLPFLFRKLDSILKITVATFFISLAFELIQLVTNTGVFDVDDLILNTTGGLAGGILFRFFIRIFY